MPPSERASCRAVWIGAPQEALSHLQLVPPPQGTGQKGMEAIDSSVQSGRLCMQKVSWCSSAVSRVAVGPTDHRWTVPGEMQALGKAALQCAERLHHPERASSLEPLLLCSSCVTWPLSTVLSRQLSSLLCPYIYLPSVVGHVTEGFNLFTALLLVIYLLYSLLSCII